MAKYSAAISIIERHTVKICLTVSVYQYKPKRKQATLEYKPKLLINSSRDGDMIGEYHVQQEALH